MAALTFWLAIALVAYAYAGYPGVLALLARRRHRPVLKSRITPPVSFIITVHNEEDRIASKLIDTLRQDYPPGSLEIIVASDCSTDRTDEIVRGHRTLSRRIRLVRAASRRGKEAAQQLAVEAAAGEILIFSDVATTLSVDGVSTIVRNFADLSVGCVSSVDRCVDADGRESGEGAYVRYEMWLRTLETRVNSLVGLSGSFFAVRRRVCRRWAPDRQSDFSTLLMAIEMGLRGVLDPEAIGYYQNVPDGRAEFPRKVRTVTRGLAVLQSNLRLLNPFRTGLFAWQLASHKLCRWLVPFAMAVALVSNIVLAWDSTFYRVLLIGQLGFYAAGIAGLRFRASLLKIPAFFLLANAAVLTAWIRYARGDRFTSWTPSRRISTAPELGSR
jgi:hypothetical protein